MKRKSKKIANELLNSKIIFCTIFFLARVKGIFSFGLMLTTDQNVNDATRLNRKEVQDFIKHTSIHSLNISDPSQHINEFVVLKKIKVLIGLLFYRASYANLRIIINSKITIPLIIYKFGFPLFFMVGFCSSRIGFYYAFLEKNKRIIFSNDCASYICFTSKKNNQQQYLRLNGLPYTFTQAYFDAAINKHDTLVESDHRFPIDIVFTWADSLDNVNDSDIQNHSLKDNDSRFNHLDELKYALRSIHRFGTCYRYIFIVVADKPPSWLDLDHPKIKLVKHKDIFNNIDNLPTYNSHAIESQLHHINELSEHFIYLNDDVIFTKPSLLSDYFLSNGIAKHFPSTDTSIPWSTEHDYKSDADIAALNNKQLIESNFAYSFDKKMKHAPFALIRSDLKKIEQLFSNEFAITAKNITRSITDLSITSSFAHIYSYLHKNSVPSKINDLYIGLDSFWYSYNIFKLTLMPNKPSVICINEVSLTNQRNKRTTAKQLLNYLHPQKSPFEL